MQFLVLRPLAEGDEHLTTCSCHMLVASSLNNTESQDSEKFLLQIAQPGRKGRKK
jgi:hypothetical protein